MDKNHGRPCSVIAKFNLQKMTPKQKETLYLIESLFSDLGVSFECSTDFLDIPEAKAQTRDWRLDESLSQILEIDFIEFLDKKRGPN